MSNNDGYGLQPRDTSPAWEDRSVGGTTRISIRPFQPDDQGLANAHMDQSRGPDSMGVHSITFGENGGMTYRPPVTQVTVGGAPDNPSGNIMATARDNAGRYTGNPGPNDTVEFQGYRTSLKAAESAGWVRRNPTTGLYEDLTQPQGQPQGHLQGNQDGTQQEEQQHPDGPEVQPFMPEHEEMYGALIAEIPQPVYDRFLIQAALDAATTGRMAVNSEALAAAGSISVEKAQAALQMAKMFFGAQANAVPHAQGIDPAEFFEWCRENRIDDLKRAVVAQMHMRDLRGYRRLLREYQAKALRGGTE